MALHWHFSGTCARDWVDSTLFYNCDRLIGGNNHDPKLIYSIPICMRTVSSLSAIDKKGAKTVNVRVFNCTWCYTECRYIDSNAAPERERDMEEGCEKRVAIETEELSAMWSGGGVTSTTRQMHDSNFHSSLRTRTVKLEYRTNDRSANCGPGSKTQATSGRICHRVLEMGILGLLNIVRLLLLLL